MVSRAERRAHRASWRAGGLSRLEASGGVTFETVADIARTGIDRIAVGSITHGVKWLDIGLDIKAAR